MAAMLVPTRVWSDTPPQRTVFEWLDGEHQFLRRYLAVVNQAAHDYGYGYQTPPEMMPVTMDFFTGYVAWLHEAESRVLYPVLRAHMTPEQQQDLRLIETDQEEENGTVKSWQQRLVQYEAGSRKMADVVETIDYLGRMINRHIVLQEERVFPVLGLLSPAEQTAVLKGIMGVEREVLGVAGRAPYERLLSYIEGRIHNLAGRIW